jgi:hypothetical protein
MSAITEDDLAGAQPGDSCRALRPLLLLDDPDHPAAKNERIPIGKFYVHNGTVTEYQHPNVVRYRP